MRARVLLWRLSTRAAKAQAQEDVVMEWLEATKAKAQHREEELHNAVARALGECALDVQSAAQYSQNRAEHDAKQRDALVVAVGAMMRAARFSTHLAGTSRAQQRMGSAVLHWCENMWASRVDAIEADAATEHFRAAEESSKAAHGALRRAVVRLGHDEAHVGVVAWRLGTLEARRYTVDRASELGNVL